MILRILKGLNYRFGENDMNIIEKYPRLLIPFGFLAGLVLGTIARAWMRWISTYPEFSWGGTLGIVIGFGIFGAVQAAVYLYRRGKHAKWRVNVARGFGVFFSLQLFIAAGAMMFPSVVMASLAVWRDSWKKWIRILLAIFSASLIIIIIKAEIVDNFGWSFATVGRILLFLAIYTVIVRVLKSTVTSAKFAKASLTS